MLGRGLVVTAVALVLAGCSGKSGAVSTTTTRSVSATTATSQPATTATTAVSSALGATLGGTPAMWIARFGPSTDTSVESQRFHRCPNGQSEFLTSIQDGKVFLVTETPCTPQSTADTFANMVSFLPAGSHRTDQVTYHDAVGDASYHYTSAPLAAALPTTLFTQCNSTGTGPVQPPGQFEVTISADGWAMTTITCDK